jgi:hypothetical protein
VAGPSAPKCAAITLKGLPCKNKAKYGPYCGVHKNYSGKAAAKAAAAPKLAHLAGKAKPTATHPPAAPDADPFTPTGLSVLDAAPDAFNLPATVSSADVAPYRPSGAKKTVGAYLRRLDADPNAKAQTKTKLAAHADGLVHLDADGKATLTPKGQAIAAALAQPKKKPTLAALSGKTPTPALPHHGGTAPLHTGPWWSKDAAKPKSLAELLASNAPIVGSANLATYFDHVMSHGKYTDAHRNATRAYSGPAYGHINANLRAGTAVPASSQVTMKNLDSAFEATPPLDRPVHVSRGVKGVAGVFPDLAPGTMYTDPGFMSTSRDRTTAESFSGYTDPGIITLRVPAGARAIAMTSPSPPNLPSNLPGEGEILLPRDSSIRIRHVTIKNGRTYIDAELIVAGVNDG